MSRRLSNPFYAGARGRITLGQAAQLGHRFVVQPKVDGSFVHVATDGRGRISAIALRNGELLGRGLADDFAGIRWAPDSVLVAEAEVWTEAANRVAAIRGYRMLHAFDALRVAGRDVSREPYRARRDALLRAESELVNAALDRPWTADQHGDAHDPATGRYIRPVPRGWRRMRVVPQLPAHQTELAWAEWVDRDGAGGPVEGLVVVALGSRLGARGSKKKVRSTTTVDCTVISVGKGAATVSWAGHVFAISCVGSQLAVGDVVELEAIGWSEKSVRPRHVRVVRVRHDLRRAA